MRYVGFEDGAVFVSCRLIVRGSWRILRKERDT
jgi:hypothetical protein